MSQVRMCDRCGKIFSENVAGWQTFTGSTRVVDDIGRGSATTHNMDACPECAIATVRGEAVTPNLGGPLAISPAAGGPAEPPAGAGG